MNKSIIPAVVVMLIISGTALYIVFKPEGRTSIMTSFPTTQSLMPKEPSGEIHASVVKSIRTTPAGIEIEVVSAKEFPVRNELAVLRIGTQEFTLSRYPESGDIHTLIFTLTPKEFIKTATGDPITVYYGRGGESSEQWSFGQLDKNILRRPATFSSSTSSLKTQEKVDVTSLLREKSIGRPFIGTCPIFPANNPWNTDVSNYPVDPNSSNYVASIGSKRTIHPSFGGNGEFGIPYNVVGAGQAMVPLLNITYANESDPGPYPIPDNAKIEGGRDANDFHLLVVDKDNCKLYELYLAKKVAGGWNAGSAAKFDLKSNALRPDGWTSADEAGLPIFPGLVRYDEVAAGAINHALRFTANDTQIGYIHPATHPSGNDPVFHSATINLNSPPLGLRLRMKADYDISDLIGGAKVIAVALKKYGMILADIGSDWYITGTADTRWDDNDLNQLNAIPGSAFEAVQTGTIHYIFREGI